MASKFNLRSTYKLNSGYEIPIMGLGVYKTPRDVTEKAVLKSFKAGYRLVDCAEAYKNEKECGEAIRNSGLKRSEIFFTTKIRFRAMGYQPTTEAILSSLREAKVDYLDLVLLHAPYGGREKREGAWKALVEAQKERKIKSIGVSNFGVHHLNELEEYNEAIGGTIDVGQYELHPWLARPDITEWLKKRNIAIEANCPLVRATKMNDPLLQRLAKNHNKTPAQVLIRWSLQKGFVPLPKSQSDKRIVENSEVFDFDLSEEDMKSLNTGEYQPVTWDPTVHHDGLPI